MRIPSALKHRVRSRCEINIKMDQIDECFRAVEEIARAAGEVIRKALTEERSIETKSCAADLVTETDQKVEKMIISTLKSKFPSHSFIGEESVAAGEKCILTDNPTWIIDPIDGTTNFVHSFPYSCISIGLAINKKIEIGLVYNPNLEEMFTARLGQGAFLNGKQIKVSNTQEMSQSLVIAEFGSNRDPEKMDAKIRCMRNVITSAHGIRSLGSCAMNMCRIACGHADAYFEYGIHCWDVAAGYIIVKEAGGVVIDPLGGPFDIMARRLVCASTEKLAVELCGSLEHIEFERD